VLVGKKRKKEEARKQRGKHQIPESKVPRQKNTKEPNIKVERSVNFKRRGGDGEGGAERRNLSLLWRKEELPVTLPVHPKIP
jgi:hypothetical protein